MANSRDLLSAGEYFLFLMQWSILVTAVLMLVIGLLRKAKGLTVLPVATYVIGYILSVLDIGHVGPTSDQATTLSAAGQLGLGAVAVFGVAIVLIYVFFIKE